jgi:uridine kinase
MLIGVVGLIGSGKGTVSDRLVERHGYQKDSFAKSLKDAVASMFNWDRALLEGDTDATLSGVKNLANPQRQDGCCSTSARK